MNRRRPEYLVVDIETIPDTSRWSRPELPHGEEDPPLAGRLAQPFPPTWAHRVIVIGCLWLDADYRLKRLGVCAEDAAAGAARRGPGGESYGLGDDDEQEAQLLEGISRFVGKQRTTLVSYNGRKFDLPVIMLRSLCHAVAIPWYYQERGVRYRYSEEGHIDLCDWLSDHGASRSGSLDALARLCGLPGKVGVDGSQVEGLYQTGQLRAIQSYCLADVTQTAFLFLRFRLLQGQIAPAAYREAVDALLAQLEGDERVRDVVAQIDRDRLRLARGVEVPPVEVLVGPEEQPLE